MRTIATLTLRVYPDCKATSRRSPKAQIQYCVVRLSRLSRYVLVYSVSRLVVKKNNGFLRPRNGRVVRNVRHRCCRGRLTRRRQQPGVTAFDGRRDGGRWRGIVPASVKAYRE